MKSKEFTMPGGNFLSLFDGMQVRSVVAALDMPFAVEPLDDGGNYLYLAYGAPGSAVTDAVWAVKRVEKSTGRTRWANGAFAFVNRADNMPTLTYR